MLGSHRRAKEEGVSSYALCFLKSTLGCFSDIIYGNQSARRVVLAEMENLRDSMFGEEQSFVDMFGLKCFLDFQVEKSKLGVWYLR